MISVKVTYTVRQEFVTDNLDNIRRFLADFKLMDDDFRYEVFLCEDGVTFMHISSYATLQVQEKVMAVPSFKEFQALRDASDIGESHTLERLTLVGISRD